MGIHSLGLALEYVEHNFDAHRSGESLEVIRRALKNAMGEHGEIVADGAPSRALTRSIFVFRPVKGDILATAFDLAGMDVSMGPACSSGAIRPSRVLLAMGYSEVEAKSAIRLSFSPYMTKGEAEGYCGPIVKVLSRFL